MTEAWVQSLFDEEPEAYGKKEPKPSGGPTGFPDRDRVGDNRMMRPNTLSHPAGAPPLDWWNVSEEEVHRRLILAMCPERVCRTCGEPSRRITEQSEEYAEAMREAAPGRATLRHDLDGGNNYRQTRPDRADHRTIGWSDCGHDDWRPGVVLDPFA